MIKNIYEFLDELGPDQSKADVSAEDEEENWETGKDEQDTYFSR